ncbi:MAG: hypothetical protein IJY12_01450 [Clostridia bacterium]|nr:hypothetical protein [Clostridia bacterium]
MTETEKKNQVNGDSAELLLERLKNEVAEAEKKDGKASDVPNDTASIDRLMTKYMPEGEGVVSGEAADDKLQAPDASLFEEASNEQDASGSFNEDDMKSATSEYCIRPRPKHDTSASMVIDFGNAEVEREAAVSGDTIYAFSTEPADNSPVEENAMDTASTEEIPTEEIASVRGDVRAKALEYTNRAQRQDIIGMYKYAHKLTSIKMIIAAVLMVFLFFYENLGIFGLKLAGVLDGAQYPLIYVLINLQIMVICCALAYDELFQGVKSIIALDPIPESVTAVVVFAGFLHTVLMAIFAKPGQIPTLFNFVVALCVFLTLAYTLYNIKREMLGFRVVSSKNSKFVLQRRKESGAKLEATAFDGISDENPDVLRVERTNFSDNYFKRTNVMPDLRLYLGIVAAVVFVVAVVMFIVLYHSGKGGLNALTGAYETVLFGLPLTIFFTYSIPFYRANRFGRSVDTAIIGEEALCEYSYSSIVSVDDTGVFPPYGVKIQSINVYDNYRIDTALHYAASGFACVGGPLADVFEVATMEIGRSENVSFVEAGEGYLVTKVDGSELICGSAKALLDRGVPMAADIYSYDGQTDPEVSVMYLACDGKLMAKMYIKYRIDSEFEQIVETLAERGMCVAVKTFDPNITEAMLALRIKPDKYPLKVVRLTALEEKSKTKERADSGIVSRGDSKSLLKILTVCEDVLRVRRLSTWIKIAASAVGLAIMCIVVASGTVGSVSSLYLALYQLAWLIPLGIATKMYLP